MVNYQNAKIYKIYSKNCDDLTMVYYGSTCQPLYKRKGGHMSKYKSWKDGRHHYVTSFKVIELGDVEIELVKKCPCNDKEELSKIEGEFIRSNPCVNKVVAGRTREEYYIDNREKLLMEGKQIYEKNKDKYIKQQKQYYVANKDKVLEYQKLYKNANLETIKKKNQLYRQKNKEKISQLRKQKKKCPFCGSLVRKYEIKRHQRTIKCQVHQ